MKRFALIGKDIKGSFSPAIHSYCFEAMGLDAGYGIIDIESRSEVSDIVAQLKEGELDAINVTAPYKKDFIQHLDQVNSRAETIGSVNCIHGCDGELIGNNTDWFGFGKALEGFSDFESVVIIGSGAVVPALTYYIDTRASCSTHIIARNLDGLRDSASSVHDISNFSLKVQNYLIINTIPYQSKIDWDNIINSIEGDAVCAMDLSYHLKATEFLNYFNSRVDTKNGLDMLIYQALMSLDIWYDKNLSLSIDVGDLKRNLIEKYYDKHKYR